MKAIVPCSVVPKYPGNLRRMPNILRGIFDFRPRMPVFHDRWNDEIKSLENSFQECWVK